MAHRRQLQEIADEDDAVVIVPCRLSEVPSCSLRTSASDVFESGIDTSSRIMACRRRGLCINGSRSCSIFRYLNLSMSLHSEWTALTGPQLLGGIADGCTQDDVPARSNEGGGERSVAGGSCISYKSVYLEEGIPYFTLYPEKFIS